MRVVTVRWAGSEVQVPQGTLLSEALRMGGLHLDTPCGGNGRCGKCVVWVGSERKLACQFVVDADVTVRVPAIPLGAAPGLATGAVPGLATSAAPGLATSAAPGWPTGAAPGASTGLASSSTANAISKRRAGLTPDSLARNAPSLDESGVPYDPWVASPGSGTAAGLAIDLGTTSIATSLVDLRTGEELASSVRPNPQAAFGADIMSRLLYATARPRNNGILQRLALESIADAFSDLLKSTEVRREDVLTSVLVGNTAMHHLALGLSVKDLSVHPYRAATLKPRDADIPGLPRLYAPPVVGSFVGSDLVAASIAVGIGQEGAGPRLLIDVGTNSEVLLYHQGNLYACSAPAGPALEGGEISQGMLALPGAVYQVSGALDLAVVGGGQPRGICGSGILDAIAALLQAGTLDRSGLMREKGPFRDRISHEPDGSLKLALAPEVFLTQKDVRSVQLAKGALRCAVDALLEKAGMTPDQLDAVYLAGAFGTSLRVESALEVGLLPPVSTAKVSQVGNAAIVGAKAILLSAGVKAEAERLAKAIQHVDLASLEGFQDRFLSSLSFGQ